MAEMIIVSTLIGFLATLAVTPLVIRFFKRTGMTVKDIHKKNTPLVARGAGVPAIVGVFLAVSAVIFIQTFILKNLEPVISLFAGLLTLLMITLAGFIDDLPRQNW